MQKLVNAFNVMVKICENAALSKNDHALLQENILAVKEIVQAEIDKAALAEAKASELKE